MGPPKKGCDPHSAACTRQPSEKISAGRESPDACADGSDEGDAPSPVLGSPKAAMPPRPCHILLRSTANSGRNISGAHQPRDPKPSEAVEDTRERVLDSPVWMDEAKPKSDNFATPEAESRMLDGFRSPCERPCWCRWARPRTVCASRARPSRAGRGSEALSAVMDAQTGCGCAAVSRESSVNTLADAPPSDASDDPSMCVSSIHCAKVMTAASSAR
eukprot:scaffold241559_cov27-Tisochrysis_lutea.AAC.2